ncbi:hypothetical protein ACUIJP_00970 [Leuconostoc pseudomesenteroides]|uniref:hypothetical protein n=1 Tax=Leuconostoc pseudomesenteroides TaxID=33968 RepID=UPI00403E27A2
MRNMTVMLAMVKHVTTISILTIKETSDNQITSLDYVGRLAVNQSTKFNTFNPYE